MLSPAEERPRALTRILAVRLALASLGAFAVLLVFFFVKYMTDLPSLRHATLQNELALVVGTLQRGGDPAALAHYRHQPAAYAFRVLERHTAVARRIWAEANAGLLPGGEAAAPGADTVGPGLLERSFDKITHGGDQGGEPLWLLTERASIGARPVWVQVAMLGDPLWRWRGVILDEMTDHVLVPALVIVPSLALAMFFAIRHALAPLLQITRQAGALAGAVAAGRPLQKLPEAGLPLEVRRVVVAMNAMLDKLGQSLQQQRQFTADAAHQLRTPLSVLMLEATQLPPGPVARRVADELEALARLVNQLLRLAQAEDAMAGDRREVEVGAAARRACEALAPLAAARGLAIEFDPPAAPAATSGHPALVDVAVGNMVDNALRHSPPGGTVSVAVGPGPRVVVEDRGPGVPEAMKPRIFERFWRTGGANGEGAGIGLALVRRIAQLHGGDVAVEDRPGGGARFVLTLAPVEDHESGRQAPRQRAVSMAPQGGLAARG